VGFEDNCRVFKYQHPQSAIVRRRDFSFNYPPLQAAIAKEVAHFAPDLIHIQNWSVFRPTLFPCLQRMGIPVLMTVHDFSLTNPNPNQVPRTGPLAPVRRALDAWAMRRSLLAAHQAVDCFLCPSQALIDELHLPKEKAHIHRLPVTVCPTYPANRSTIPLRLFFAGSLYPSKGVDLLLKASAQCEIDVKLELAGVGEQENNLKDLCKALKLNDRVKFLGNLDQAEMAQAYQRCHLLVLPSRVPENSPLVILEAAAHGKAAIASQLGGICEMIGDRRGWTFPSKDESALSKLLDQVGKQPEKIMQRGARIKEYVQEKHNPEKHWEQLEYHYSQLSK